MPLPVIIVLGSAAAAALGLGSGANGVIKGKKASDTMKFIQERHRRNIDGFEKKSERANEAMDTLGKYELNILKSFENFSDTIEKIQNRPQFEKYRIENVELPTYDKENLEKVSIGAGVLLGGLGGAAVGTAGGFAAAGATSAAVMAWGTASTGIAIESLSGAAAVNATLAALGGGSLAVGGGGMALGSLVLGTATAGVGILISGIVFNFVGKKLEDKADEAYKQVEEEEQTIKTIGGYLRNLEQTAFMYQDMLQTVNNKYQECFSRVSNTVNKLYKTEWNEFDERERADVQNAVLLVGLLYKMCRVNLVNKAEEGTAVNRLLNKSDIFEAIETAKGVLEQIK